MHAAGWNAQPQGLTGHLRLCLPLSWIHFFGRLAALWPQMPSLVIVSCSIYNGALGLFSQGIGVTSLPQPFPTWGQKGCHWGGPLNTIRGAGRDGTEPFSQGLRGDTHSVPGSFWV